MHIAIKIFFSVIAILACAFGGFYYYNTSYNNGYRGDFKETRPGAGTGAKKALIVFQPSRDGVSTEIARQIAGGISEGGYEVTISYPGDHLPTDLKDYDILAFGSPVYFGSVSAALTDYIQKAENISNKKIAIYSVGNLKENKELDIIEKSLKGIKPYAKEKFIATDKTSPESAHKFGAGMAK